MIGWTAGLRLTHRLRRLMTGRCMGGGRGEGAADAQRQHRQGAEQQED